MLRWTPRVMAKHGAFQALDGTPRLAMGFDPSRPQRIASAGVGAANESATAGSGSGQRTSPMKIVMAIIKPSSSTRSATFDRSRYGSPSPRSRDTGVRRPHRNLLRHRIRREFPAQDQDRGRRPKRAGRQGCRGHLRRQDRARPATATSLSGTSTTPCASALAKPTLRRSSPAQLNACEQEFDHDDENICARGTWRDGSPWLLPPSLLSRLCPGRSAAQHHRPTRATTRG